MGTARSSPSSRPVLVGAAFLAVAATALVAAGKPGYPDTITWRGVTWNVKTSRSAVGPGPNIFAKDNVWVDDSDNLHLRISKNTSNQWTCAEIVGPVTYGYGTYTFDLASRVDNLDPNVVLGLFTWSDRAPYAHREIDIEFARWGNATDLTNAQYVVQPYSAAGHLVRFTMPGIATSSLHRFTWQRNEIAWESHDTASGGSLIDSYSYSGADIPKTGDERVRLNLWLFNGAAPTSGTGAEVVVSSFTFSP